MNVESRKRKLIDFKLRDCEQFDEISDLGPGCRIYLLPIVKKFQIIAAKKLHPNNGKNE